MHKKGIKYVRDLFNVNYSTYTHKEFEQKYEVKINFLRYFGIITSIPREYKNQATKNIEKLTIYQQRSKTEN